MSARSRGPFRRTGDGAPAGTAIIAAVTPLLLVAAGGLALVAAVLTLLSLGPRFRVGRLLASAPHVTVAEAVALAAAGTPRYVRVEGRIDAEEEFEDADHRPLVFRRTRIEAQTGRRWSRFEDSREAVTFEVREGLDSIQIDTESLDEGLIVIPRESIGVAGDLGERAPSTVAAETPVRAVIEQISSVEHATILGVPMPAATAGGLPRMTAGLGRPLVLTTLETPEAMRILAGGTGRPRFAAVLFAVGAALVVVGLAWAGIGALVSAAVPVTLAASPTPATGGDPRSSGEGPGLVGDPGIALLAVILIAAVAIAATTIYLRLTDAPRESPKR